MAKREPIEYAPAGMVWVCRMCGKRSRTWHGCGGTAIDKGYDESCMLNAALCHERTRPDPALGECYEQVEPQPKRGDIGSEKDPLPSGESSG